MKKILVLAIALVFALSMVSFSFAAADSVKGTVSKIEANKITVKDIKGKETTVEVKDAKGIKVGDKVEIKDGKVTKESADTKGTTKKKKKVIEGC